MKTVSKKIKITKGGIYSGTGGGELAVGTVLDINLPEGVDLDTHLAGWRGRFELIGDGDGKTVVQNNEGGNGGGNVTKKYDAKHKGAGVYAIYKVDAEGKTTDEIVRDKLAKDVAEAFDKLDLAGQEKWLEDNKAA